MTHAEPMMVDMWSCLADLLANLIAKYAPLLDLDEPTESNATNIVLFPQEDSTDKVSPAIFDNHQEPLSA